MTVDAVEDAQHDALAKLRGQRRDAEIHLAAGDGLLDAAVLRQAALGDVEIRHDLDARDDRQRQVPGRRGHLVERAVHAVADLEFVLERLEMDVAGPVLDGLVEDQIHVADDGRGVGLGLDVLQFRLALLAVFERLRRPVPPGFHSGSRRPRRRLLDQRLDLLDGRDDDLDGLAQGEAQILGDLRIEGIGEADGDGIADRR